MTTNKMLAFHNDPKIKEKYVQRIKEHAAADRIIKGEYWNNGKGCAVGCTIEGNEHNKYETELGIPSILAHLEDNIFESLSNAEAMTFPLRFIEAIPVGADLSNVFAKLVVWEWEDSEHGLKNIKEIREDTELYTCCEKVCSLYKRHIAGNVIPDQEWKQVEMLADALYASASASARARAFARAFAFASASASASARAFARAFAFASARASASASDFELQITTIANALIKILKESN